MSVAAADRAHAGDVAPPRVSDGDVVARVRAQITAYEALLDSGSLRAGERRAFALNLAIEQRILALVQAGMRARG